MKIMLSGSSGLIGEALRKMFESSGDEVIRLGRDFEKPLDFSGVDAVIHLAGEPIAEGRWTAVKKGRIEESRVVGTQRLAEQIQSSENRPDHFICASAIGYYGDRNDEILTEESGPGKGFLPRVCVEWEAAAAPAIEAGVRTVFLRTGIVLSTEGGALKKMLPPFKMGGGGKLGSGKQYMSWISLDDMTGAINFLLKNESVTGPVNLTAPNPVTNQDFTKILGSVLNRPTILPLPGFAARMLFGEMADALLLSSSRVLPKRLEKEGYSFKHADLKNALEDIL